jgi:hypothetical protein
VSAVGGTTWCFDKETMLLTYKALMMPVFSHSPAVWVPNTKPSNIKKLQIVQNRCLRRITGCHQAASIDHLHAETGILPFQKRLGMLCAQFLASAMRPMHPSHYLVLLPPGPRKNKYGRPLKETLSSRYMKVVEPYLNQNGIMAEVSYKRAIESIHTSAVRNAIKKQKINPLIGRIPPPVNVSEERLSRTFRTTLSQLRSTYCSALKSYQAKIRNTNDDTCPECNSAPQTVLHLFSCTAYPTQLKPIDLWHNPILIARLLISIPTFDHLPPLCLSPVAPPS